jgi:hypothetical protein
VEEIDWMYLNVSVPKLQCGHGAVEFFGVHRNQPWASSALMSRMSRRFVAAMELSKMKASKWFSSERGSERTMSCRPPAQVRGRGGIVFIGKAQEKAPVFRTEKRRNLRTGQSYPRIVKIDGDGEH